MPPPCSKSPTTRLLPVNLYKSETYGKQAGQISLLGYMNLYRPVVFHIFRKPAGASRWVGAAPRRTQIIRLIFSLRGASARQPLTALCRLHQAQLSFAPGRTLIARNSEARARHVCALFPGNENDAGRSAQEAVNSRRFSIECPGRLRRNGVRSHSSGSRGLSPTHGPQSAGSTPRMHRERGKKLSRGFRRINTRG